ncbi:transcriptional regulator [Elizabethkingia meningoseptica]|uniref:AraC family transcriptional regulator n=1 Tax=Elizabethkingia meningoseptica TaxID=238 RepID=A0A1V3U502_ELIME|nr:MULTISPECIES: helix-turn-helix domain-containing protein [Elizabethkingia]AQX11197.1 transcriptional regulator [Elizabethkingia meningoseptica]MDX8576159.1 helix-turn-helix domain-containing protein [Elizabethkingia sp. HX WYD]ODM52758.1 transcriptional regulator [Elizabethkingia meningoseptica]OHT27668.1 transcriptional regulator [Elizabethkingia meningoseptica]OHT31120.1 transcriptional regulator [Elizabethkingia meningoseptica]
MRIILSFFLLLLYNTGKSQSINLSETEVVNRFDEISLHDMDDKYFIEVKKLYEYSKDKNYISGIIKGLVNIQRYYIAKGDYQEALRYGEIAEENAKKYNDNNALSNIYMRNGFAYARLDMFTKSKEALKKALESAKKIDILFDRNVQLSKIYVTFAGVSEGEGLNNNTLLYYLKKSLNILETIPTQNLSMQQESDYYSLLIKGYLNLGSFYSHFMQPSDFGKAEYYYSKALVLSKKYPKYFESSALFTYFTIGHFYFQKKDYTKSIEYFEKVLEREKKEKDSNMKLQVYDNLKNLYDSLGNVSQQNKYLKLYSNLSDSINRAKNQTVVLQLDKTNQKVEKEHKSLRRSFITYGLISSLLVSLFGVYWYRRSRLLKKNYNLLIAKLEHSGAIEEVPLPTDIEQNSDTAKNTISSEKETELIKKLKAFETSGKFLRKGISLSYLAHSFSTNPRQLSLVINKNKNKTFNDYINELRIKYITDQLYNNPVYREYKISYLAEECGYASHQVFINAFRKETGMTPSYFIAELSRQ